MKIKALIAISTFTMITFNAFAATTTLFESLIWCGGSALPAAQNPNNMQNYTADIPIMSDGSCHVPVAFENESKGDVDFFSTMFTAIQERAVDIVSVAPNASNPEILLHIMVVSTGGTALSDSDANTLLTGSKIIGSSFNIGTTNDCFLIAIKKSGTSEEEIEDAINQILTAAMGHLSL